uniref:Arrestin domain containing 1 n=1 Tax=Neovison vison TaxID=452646 RepID=A0A8C7BC36_NEOVI
MGDQQGACCVRVRLAWGDPDMSAIRVTCTGSCRVSNKANDAAWVVEEGYFNSALSLADKGSLPAGEHSFPFQFLLPATAPTSFEGPFGKIVHQVRATIDTPRFSKDHQCSRVFYILSPLNLNSIPDIEQPNVASTTKKFSYKLVKTGSVVLTASTDLRGYVVGQVLRLQADIENQSGKDTGPVVASLLQKVSYKAKRWIYDVRTIAEVEGAGVKAWRRAQWQEQILVPALPQSALPGCSLIHVDYYLQVGFPPRTPISVCTSPLPERGKNRPGLGSGGQAPIRRRGAAPGGCPDGAHLLSGASPPPVGATLLGTDPALASPRRGPSPSRVQTPPGTPSRGGSAPARAHPRGDATLTKAPPLIGPPRRGDPPPRDVPPPPTGTFRSPGRAGCRSVRRPGCGTPTTGTPRSPLQGGTPHSQPLPASTEHPRARAPPWDASQDPPSAKAHEEKCVRG